MIKIKPSIITISFIIISTRVFATSVTDLLENQDELFKKLFPTSSFAEFKQFEAEIEQKHPKSVEKIRNKAIVVIAAPNKVRLSICSQGFKNLHQTGTSKGATDKRKRLYVEASLLNIKHKYYKNTHHNIKPKYGFITTWKQLSITARTGFSYGEDFYVLDLKQVKDRITWTPGDSLDRASRFSSKIANYKCHEASSWDQIFIPWKYRLLMIPYLIEPDKGFPSIKNSEFVNPSIANMNPILGSNCYNCYIEAQIFGELNLSHISALVASQIPNLKSLQYLYESKVNIFDKHSMRLIDTKQIIEQAGQELLDIKFASIHNSDIFESLSAIGRKGKKLHVGNQAKTKSRFLKRSKKVGKILKFFLNGKTLVIKNGKKKYVDTHLLSE